MSKYSAPQPMKQIGGLFEKYKRLLKAPQATVKKMVTEIVKEKTGYNIDQKKIDYNVHTKTIYLHLPAILKTELLFQKESILKELQKQLGENEAPTTII